MQNEYVINIGESISFEIYDYYPVIAILFQNKEFLFIVDSGCGSNYIYYNIDKENINQSDFYLSIDGEYKKNLTFRKINPPEYAEKNKIFGILGMPFLKNFETVTFDYKKSLLIFNLRDETFDNELPMWFVPGSLDKWCYTEFRYNGKPEFGIIDTGASIMVTREHFGNGRPQVDRVKFVTDYNSKTKIPTYNYHIKKIKEIYLGNFNYKDLESLPYNSKYLLTQGNLITAKYYNFLGYPIFKDHIIQIDFTNMKFRIK